MLRRRRLAPAPSIPSRPQLPWEPGIEAWRRFILVVSSLTLVEYATGWNQGIDNLVIRDMDTVPAEFPGRMSIATATSFLLVVLALFAATLESPRSLIHRQVLALIVMLISSAALTGYLYGVQQFRLLALSTMAIHTSALSCSVALDPTAM